ncbi:MAG: VWA domain-containing protein [Alistipes sp.]|nr:VWA domain-containing protein [Alistipes sp.]
MYSQEITRRHRTAFIIALDQSTSMQEEVRFGRLKMSKAEAVAYTANILITELIDRSRRKDGVRNYYDIAVVGYSDDEVRMLLSEDGFVSVKSLAERIPEAVTISFEESMPDKTTALVKHHIHPWIEPKAEGNTPMYEALLRIREMVEEWCEQEQNRQSFPPIVFNITDGEASDCDDNELRYAADMLRRTGTEDGQTLLINIHLSTDLSLPSMIFPMAEELLSANRYARLLAECSSLMPECFNAEIGELKISASTPPYRGMGYNASVIELLSIINIGSRSITNME